jgi:hypothetical protein
MVSVPAWQPVVDVVFYQPVAPKAAQKSPLN